jgi:hypothetical protein
MKLISKCLFPADLSPGEYAYPGPFTRYYVKRTDNGSKCGVVSRMFSDGVNLFVDSMSGNTYRVTGDSLEYQLCAE